jgi:hypothetical protein
MLQNPTSLSLQKLLVLDSNWERRASPNSYNDYVDVLYDDFVEIFELIEGSRSKRQDDDEDRLTLDICNLLAQRKVYSANHNVYSGGNVDITVRHKSDNYQWIGEAKIYRQLDDMNEGFLQLTTRYVSSPPNDCAGVIAYVKRPNAAALMKAWRVKLESNNLPDMIFANCNRRGELQFHSSHTHEGSGLPFRVWHACVLLHHKPQDKSARNRKSKK